MPSFCTSSAKTSGDGIMCGRLEFLSRISWSKSNRLAPGMYDGSSCLLPPSIGATGGIRASTITRLSASRCSDNQWTETNGPGMLKFVISNVTMDKLYSALHERKHILSKVGVSLPSE